MRTLLSLCAKFVLFGAVALCLSASKISLADAPAKANDQATQLVQKVLMAEAAGKPDDRTNILQQALQIAPDFAPAHWQMGEVQTDGKWISIDDAAKLDSHSAKMDEYRQLRDQAAPMVDDQLNLARWCEKAGLKEQQRAHLMFALQMQPNNKEAISKLGLVRFQRQLVPVNQLDEIKAKLQDSREESKEWKAKIDAWHAQLQQNPHDQEVLKQIRAERDPGALHFISRELANSGQDACLAIIDAMAEIHQQWTTETLIRAALYSQYKEVRARAVYALKSRSPYGYVPLLLSAMKTPIRYQYEVLTFDPHNFANQLTIFREGVFQDEQIVANHKVTATSPIQYINPRNIPLAGPDPSPNALAQAARAEQQSVQVRVSNIERENAASAERNEVLANVLRDTTGQEIGSDPTAWWDWWYDYNEYYRPPEKPVNVTRDDSIMPIVLPRNVSCFVAGTSVWTMTGPMQIEKVKVGELVLAQNLETGELAYKPVIDTTFRPASPTLEVHLGERLIRATRGHPFWVSGKGWQMAKELQAGDWLHTVHGGVKIDAVEPSEDAECYNLVVADFHDYFVGDAKVLVHDNLLRSPTGATVPGLAEAQ